MEELALLTSLKVLKATTQLEKGELTDLPYVVIAFSMIQ